MAVEGIPRKYEDVVLDDYVVEDGHGSDKGLTAAETFVEELEERVAAPFGRGMLLYGGPGVGKTMLACAVLNEAERLDVDGYFITLEHYARIQRGVYGHQEVLTRSSDTQERENALEHVLAESARLKRIRNRVPLLVVDDIGKEHRTGGAFVEDEFDFLLRRREHLGLTTILTSNKPPSVWKTLYNSAMESFLYEICDLIVSMNDCEDYRMKGRRGAKG